MGYGTAKKLAVEHRRQDDIHRISGLSRYGLRAIEARTRFADDLKVCHFGYPNDGIFRWHTYETLLHLARRGERREGE
jgi:hypothetical protein